jgi:hypothetical protein
VRLQPLVDKTLKNSVEYAGQWENCPFVYNRKWYAMEERECEWCRDLYRPRVPDQRFCCLSCRQEMKAAEGRAARRVWRAAGRPMIELTPVRLEEAEREAYRRF